MTFSSTFATKLARFQKGQERKRMSKRFRKRVADLLFEKMQQSADSKEITALAGQLAKFVPVPKPPNRKRGPQTPIEVKEPSLDELVTALEKKRKAAQKAGNGGSTEVG